MQSAVTVTNRKTRSVGKFIPKQRKAAVQASGVSKWINSQYTLMREKASGKLFVRGKCQC